VGLAELETVRVNDAEAVEEREGVGDAVIDVVVEDETETELEGVLLGAGDGVGERDTVGYGYVSHPGTDSIFDVFPVANFPSSPAPQHRSPCDDITAHV
jgi:hypothetical protein